MTDTDARGKTDHEDEDELDRLFPFEEDPEHPEPDADDPEADYEGSKQDADSSSETQGGAVDRSSTADPPIDGEADGELDLDRDVELAEETLGPVRDSGPTSSPREEFDGDLSTLEDDARIEREQPPEQPAGNRLSTGIEPLDRQLDGGIPPGRLVTFAAPPDAQSELLIKELATERNTLYLSTLRPRWEIEEELRDHIQRNHDSGDARDARIEQLPTDARLETARTYIDELENRSLLIVNAANELENEAEHRYAEFLNAVKEVLWDTASIGLFYQIKDEQSPPGRTITLRRSDLVWELHKSMQNTGIDNYLEVSKFRGGSALDDPLKLKLTDEVEIDTSRDIA